MNTTWGDVAKILPAGLELFGKVMGGPIGIVAQGAGELAAHALGVDATPDAVSEAIKADPTAAAHLAEVQVTTAAQLQQAAMTQTLELAKLSTSSTTALNAGIVADVADARKANAGNDKVYDVGLFILGSFFLAMIAVLWGCWSLISGEVRVTPEMAGMFAAVTGLVGAIVGYFASNAQTVVNFLFGGSLGGRKNADALSDSVASMGTALGKAANTPSPTTMIDSTVTAPR